MSNHKPGHIRDHRNFTVPDEVRTAVHAYLSAAGGKQALSEITGLRPVQLTQIARGQHSKTSEEDIEALVTALRM